MIVSRDDILDVTHELSTHDYIAFDTETTGLNCFLGDRLFSLSLACGEDLSCSYYFNFDDNLENSKTNLPYSYLEKIFSSLKPSVILFAHNAKFDLLFLKKEGVDISKFNIHCTEVFARVLCNDLESYSLDYLSKYYGLGEKDKTLEEYIKKNNLYTVIQDELTLESVKKPQYKNVPLEIISRYARNDAVLTYKLGMFQLKRLNKETYCFSIEKNLIHTLIKIETDGILIDKLYVKKAYDYEKSRIADAEREFKKLTGCDLVDSSKSLSEILIKNGVPLGITEKGNSSISSYVLKKYESNDVVSCILKHRDAIKRANTYWANIYRYLDKNNIIHPSFRQSGASTMRMSCTSPNFQNIPKRHDDESDFPVRKAILAKDNYYILELDYKAQEFRVALDYADEVEFSKKVVDGLDPHDETSKELGISRFEAKTLNFALLYGVGVSKLSEMLKCSEAEAREKRDRYFRKYKGLSHFFYTSKKLAESRGFVKNFFGMVYYFKDKNLCYKAANTIVQGSCAYITKYAMNLLHKFLKSYKSHIFLQVHDSINIYLHKDETHIIPSLVELMKQAYPFGFCKMDVSIEISETNWHDLSDAASFFGCKRV